jgi:hypothetical protein
VKPSVTDLETPFRFTPASIEAMAADDLVRQSQREIAHLVNEVASAARTDQTPRQFSRLLVDRTLRALVAQGVVLWQYKSTSATQSARPFPIDRCGTTTDQTLTKNQALVVADLVSEVAEMGVPVVVPPTPIEDLDPSTTQAINPTSYPLAIVPVPMATAMDGGYAIGVFLEPGGNVATQRGYLRFIAQMADLAGGYFAANHSRHLQRLCDWSKTVDQELATLSTLNRSIDIHDRLVDVVAEQFRFDRVVLCRLHRKGHRSEIVSASHCDHVDRHSHAAGEILALAHQWDKNDSKPDLSSDNLLYRTWIQESGDSSAIHEILSLSKFAEVDCGQSHKSKSHESKSHESKSHESKSHESKSHESKSLESKSLVSKSTQTGSNVTPVPSSFTWVLVATRLDGTRLSDAARRPMDRWIAQAHAAAMREHRLESIPWGRLLAGSERTRRGRLRTVITSITIAATLAGAMFLPMPLSLTVPAVLMPEQLQTVFSPRDSVVETVHVTHDQEVKPGDPLITLRSPEMDEDRIRLQGRQNVLRQRRISISNDLVGAGDRRRQDQLQSEQIMIDEEIAAVTAELESLDRWSEELTLRSRVAGRVDAWQIEQTLQSRPIRRGDLILRVLPETSDWTLQANVPMSDVGKINRAVTNQTLSAQVIIDGSDHDWVPLVWDRLGPARRPSKDETSLPLHQVCFRLGGDQRPDDVAWRSDASGQIMIRCGWISLGRWMWGDSIDQAQKKFTHWFGGGDQP